MEMVDDDALSLQGIGGFFPLGHLLYHWEIFRNFLDSGDPLALDGQRYSIVALACLKIIFKHYRALVSRIQWLSQHLRVDMERSSHRCRRVIPAGTDWGWNIPYYWHTRALLPSWTRGIHVGIHQFQEEKSFQKLRSRHLSFILKEIGALR